MKNSSCQACGLRDEKRCMHKNASDDGHLPQTLAKPAWCPMTPIPLGSYLAVRPEDMQHASIQRENAPDPVPA